ncbi:MAG: hypothetical protein ABEL04_09605 [Salinibacter sp.]|uniref:hypothetical protein n=1 Tax=Salinibacter sp. TaxID=2065818 RepID=UPI0035D4A0A4
MSEHTSSGRSKQSSAGEPENGSHQELIGERSLLLEGEEEKAPEFLEPNVEAIQTLIDKADCQGATYQSVAVAAVQILERALRYEREAADAALSLGQQEKLESMVETAEQATSVLRSTLSAQGHKVMHLRMEEVQSPSSSSASSRQHPWWFVLTDALEVLEEGTDRMTSLTTGQPVNSPARELSQHVAQLLRGHHDTLLLEAEDWIS